ncbi:MAG: hypothetical protein BGO41_10200 [Clostridiales bacterium 38-18]|nr:MAG: hypothetical protein BGO41_10200 [Clostridiales bacterium 38-18]
MYSTKFSVSLHILSLIALKEEKSITSDYIAGSINTNPVLVRRLMSLLKKSGLIVAQTKIGATGLAKPANEISMKEIFIAVEGDAPIFKIHEDTNQNCPVGARIGSVVTHVNHQMKEKFNEELDSIYLIDILMDLDEQTNINDHTEVMK